MHYTYEVFLADSADNNCSLAVVFSGIKQESDDHEFSTQGSPPPPGPTSTVDKTRHV